MKQRNKIQKIQSKFICLFEHSIRQSSNCWKTNTKRIAQVLTSLIDLRGLDVLSKISKKNCDLLNKSFIYFYQKLLKKC